jgi:hypothetical protein
MKRYNMSDDRITRAAARLVAGWALAVALAFAAVGCKSNKHGKHSFVHPPDIDAMCVRARDTAKADIEKKIGKPLSIKASAVVTKQVGEKKIGKVWCWREPTLSNMWIAGLTDFGNPVRIKIGCAPSGKETLFGTAHHEYGHYWLGSNFHDYGHNPAYAKIFEDWRDGAAKVRTRAVRADGRLVVICEMEDEP